MSGNLFTNFLSLNVFCYNGTSKNIYIREESVKLAYATLKMIV